MRIFDEKNQRPIDSVTLFLTLSEAKELRGDLDQLILDHSDANHKHVSDETYQHEVTVCIYDRNNLNGFSDEAKRLLLED